MHSMHTPATRDVIIVMLFVCSSSRCKQGFLKVENVLAATSRIMYTDNRADKQYYCTDDHSAEALFGPDVKISSSENMGWSTIFQPLREAPL